MPLAINVLLRHLDSFASITGVLLLGLMPYWGAFFIGLGIGISIAEYFPRSK
jgi:hypothetical protein